MSYGNGNGNSPLARKARKEARACPECGRVPLDEPELYGRDGTGTLILCHGCAALSVLDAGKLRPPRTQEWFDLMLEPRWYDVLEERQRLLEALTAPPIGFDRERESA